MMVLFVGVPGSGIEVIFCKSLNASESVQLTPDH